MTKKNNKKTTTSIGGIIIIIFLAIYGLEENISNSFSIDTNSIDTNITGELKVTFIDVGQADSILIQNDNENMLIDAGNNEDGDKLVDYFTSLNIDNFKYVVGTHPHEDHIGGLDNIINNFNIDYIYMPDVVTTTSTFESVIDSIDNKNMKITIPQIGDNITLGSACIEIIYTGTDSSDLNNTSIVLKLTYGNTSFLFTGDATSEVEKQIVNKDIKADVLKVGHHGSKYSSTLDFLEAVDPKYAVISVGLGNSYGHPADTTINNLNKLGINIYRTDELGTIVITSDGNNIEVNNYKTNTNGE